MSQNSANLRILGHPDSLRSSDCLEEEELQPQSICAVKLLNCYYSRCTLCWKGKSYLSKAKQNKKTTKNLQVFKLCFTQFQQVEVSNDCYFVWTVVHCGYSSKIGKQKSLPYSSSCHTTDIQCWTTIPYLFIFQVRWRQQLRTGFYYFNFIFKMIGFKKLEKK